VHQEPVNCALSSVVARNCRQVDDAADNDVSGHVLHRASPLPPDVARFIDESPPPPPQQQQEQQKHVTTDRRDSGEYDPSIWDFLPPAPGDDDDDDDADKDSGTQVDLRSPREVDTRSIKHAQAVREIVETEISYGNDLAIIKRVRNTVNIARSKQFTFQKTSIYLY